MVKIFNELQLGHKIKSERLKISKSLDSFAQQINISRQTLSRWEKGEGAGPSVIDLLKMCEVFGCDFGYLVGEYESRSREATDIRDETGLSEPAVENLLEATSRAYDGGIDLSVSNCSDIDVRSYEVGRVAKPRFVEVLLENKEIWERLSVCAYDYRRQMQISQNDPLLTVEGVPYSLLASVAKEEAKEAISALFEKIDWDTFSSEWEEG